MDEVELQEAIDRFNRVAAAIESTYKAMLAADRRIKMKHKRPKLRKSTKIKYNPRVKRFNVRDHFYLIAGKV